MRPSASLPAPLIAWSRLYGEALVHRMELRDRMVATEGLTVAQALMLNRRLFEARYKQVFAQSGESLRRCAANEAGGLVFSCPNPIHPPC
jgi:hypothetical protein